MNTTIGIVTGGGDCPGLNAVIRAVVKTASRLGWETLGFLGGYEGLLEPVRYRQLDYHEMGGLLQRGGGPTNFDRALCTLFGTTAVALVAERQFGRMVTYTGTQISSVPLADAIGHLRTVPLDGGFVRAARAIGISLGD